MISARDWFHSGERLPYDTITKNIVAADVAPSPPCFYAFHKLIKYAPEGPRRLISFLPGFPLGSYDWARIETILAKDNPMDRLYIEYIGQGESDKPDNYPYSTFERADLVEAFWRHHHVSSTVVVTFDYSSLVAMELLQRQQDAIEKGVTPSTVITKVLFINGGYFTDGHTHPLFTTPLLQTRIGKRSTIKAQSSDFTFNRMLKGMWSKRYGVSESELAEVRDAIRRRNGMLFLHYAAGFVNEHKANGRRLDLQAIVERMHKNVSFFIVGSDKDQFEPKQVRLAKKRLDKYGVDIRVLPGGHMITMEQPGLLADMVRTIAK